MDAASRMPGTRLKHRLIDTLLRSSVPDLLRYADRCSMRHSIECRVPFLTTDLANLALSLPDDALIAPDGTTKHVFREAIRPFVPDTIVDRSDKLGFPTPESQWMETLSHWVAEKLDSASAREGLPIDLAAVRADFDRVRKGRANYSWRFWRVVNLIEWAEIFDVSFSVPSAKSEPSYGD
jgi:asparagine synthase (glutamine-hydrolysing)